MNKSVLAILTESIRYDNHHPLQFFAKIEPVHFYEKAPYGDLKKDDLKGAVKYDTLKDLEDKLLALKPDIIQGAEPYGSKKQLGLCYVAWRVSRKLKIPLIFGMLENRPVKERFGPVLAPMLKKVLAAYAKQAKMIFYLNSGAKRNLLEGGADPAKLKKLLYGIWGVDTQRFAPNVKCRMQNVELKDTILFAGRLDEAKGLPYLLEAWEMVRQDYPDVQLIVAGKGEMEDIVRGEGVTKLGVLPTRDLPALFNSALFTVYPSVTLKRWEEQVGTVNLQSLACGTPVITTKSGAIPEYVNEKVGILVAERDSKALAEAMKKLLKDRALISRLGENGRQYILENFDAEKTINKVENLLLGLL